MSVCLTFFDWKGELVDSIAACFRIVPSHFVWKQGGWPLYEWNDATQKWTNDLGNADLTSENGVVSVIGAIASA